MRIFWKECVISKNINDFVVGDETPDPSVAHMDGAGHTLIAQKTGNSTQWYYYDSDGGCEDIPNGKAYFYSYDIVGRMVKNEASARRSFSKQDMIMNFRY